MLIHGGMKKYKIAHKVFDLNDVRPEFINILFDEKTVKGNESNGNFECLFNLLDWNEFVDMSIIDTGGVFPVIKIAIQNGIHFKFVNVIDFFEPRLDINYYHCNLDVDIAFSLINYMYIHDEKLVDIIESDVALCINPISNSGSFQGINMSSIAYS